MPWRVFFRLSLVLALAAVPAVLRGQYPQTPPLPQLLYVRLTGPEGLRVTVYRGGQGQTLVTPCVIGVRPGYAYRLQLSGLPGRPNLAVYPSFDVLGSLRVPTATAAEHPATLNFTETDFDNVVAGAVVTKLVILERPENAFPVATTANEPLEEALPPNRNLLVLAQDRGRPVLMLHMGEREYTPQELGQQNLPGTMLLPNEKVLSLPRVPPCLPYMCYPLVDPRAGLDSPADEMCFHDGGDSGMRVGYDSQGRLRGLDPSDTVAQYQDSQGHLKIAISNRVCLCVPRFIVLRTEMTLASNTLAIPTRNTIVSSVPAKIELETNTHVDIQQVAPLGIISQQRLSFLSQETHTVVVGRVEGLRIVKTEVKPGDVTGTCPGPEQQDVEKPLVIIKWPDRCDPHIGDSVTFYIQYKNQGQRPIDGIIVSDSLTARLEYVPGTARTDRDALFTTTPNEANSLILRWEVAAPLQPGQTGIVSFQARVR